MTFRQLNRRFLRFSSDIHIQNLRASLPISNALHQAATSIDGLERIRPSESFVRARIPLSDRSFFQRLKYRLSDDTVRTGRMLEDFDSMAVAASYKHNTQLANDGQIPLSIVTACVDEIRFFPAFHTHSARNEDLILTGQVCWVGRSSMDVLCAVENDQGEPLVKSHFIMVARCPKTQKAAPVIQLNPESKEEIQNHKHSEELSQNRKRNANMDVLSVQPTNEEMSVVHSLYKLTTGNGKTESFSVRELPPNSIWMEDAKLKSVLVCQPESRNIHNKIFGGWLMRQAVELAWITACSITDGNHRIIFVDDILFKEPVEIGSVLMLHSQIIYSEKNRFQMRVRIEKRTPNSMREEGVATNVLHLTFEADEDVPQIMPKTYGESMLYLTGKRHYDIQAQNYHHVFENSSE